MVSQKILAKLRKCVEDYDMLREGDVVAVGLSGGKDSMATLAALKKLSEFYPERFTVKAVSIGLTRDMSAYGAMEDFCRSLVSPPISGRSSSTGGTNRIPAPCARTCAGAP